MLWGRLRAFALAAICVPAVFGDDDDGDPAATGAFPRNRFNALDEFSLSANRTEKVIEETYNRVPAPPESPYQMIERQGVLAELQKKTAYLRQENVQLEAAKTTLLGNCNGKLRRMTEAYNAIVASLNVDVPEVKLWERRLQVSLLTKELVVKALKEAADLVGFLGLKKSVLMEDIALLEARHAHYPTCQDYRRLVTVEPGIPGVTAGPGGPEGPIQVRSGPLGLRSPSATDMGKILFERKRALMEVKLEQEKHVNRELKNVIKFYVGYCSRSVESLKKRIELLRAYPGGDYSLEELKGQVQVVETEIVQKKGELAALKEELLRLAAEVRELQARYESLREMSECFLDLVRFRVDGLVESLSRTILAVERRGAYTEQGMVVNDAAGSAPPRPLPKGFGEVPPEGPLHGVPLPGGPLPGGPLPGGPLHEEPLHGSRFTEGPLREGAPEGLLSGEPLHEEPPQGGPLPERPGQGEPLHERALPEQPPSVPSPAPISEAANSSPQPEPPK